MARISKPELIALQKKLVTDEAIGRKFKITRQAVHQLRKKYGIEASTAKNVERDKKMVALYKTGKSGAVVAKRFDMSISQTYRILGDGRSRSKK
jgi:hypothetical protein